MTRHALFAALLVIPLAVFGCGSRPDSVPVGGTITVRNKPEAKLLVQFTATKSATGKPAAGNATSDSSGKFVIAGDDGKPGLPPGEYIVTVADRNLETDDEDLAKGKRSAPNRVDKKYLSADEKLNPLKIKVEAGKTTYDLNLD